ncbi:AAA family ATPase [Colletotrichum chrysophilum]|uniref:AAA family ATPase n=1 Tax=Colletotrichum chrysophilum TaxID=1836956 RepID=A0AAD9AWJ6_9PEZI|nr:AAA family ATPase [Colletotrichum chrysophilum]
MASLVASDPETFSDWESHMTPPYIHVYHTRQRIRDIASQTSNETHRTHLLGFLAYVESSFAKEYQEADNLFARGRVTRKHFAKLFGPNEVVVTFEDGEPSNPRYMIDMETYRQLHDEEEDKSDTRHVLEEGLMDNDEPPGGPFVMLLPTTMVGFGMHDKKWHVIEGKGNGLIILLHGGPGTGKTLTAESVAELAKKPLYRVTCGDIGTDPESVEKYLESAFYIATIWEAVLLLDESDVFLEQRQKTDLERNALVSVFLRALEYYEGIMILTSNRVGTFDDAFRSRMQLALYYPPLDEKGRMTIWTNFIYLLEEEQKELDQATSNEKDMVDIQDLRRMAPVLAKENFNGRQIRNVITTARQLARFTGRRMESKHVQRTMAVAKEFEDYVDKARDDPNILESSL